MFESLYYDMKGEVTREHTTKYGTAPEMTEDEKTISFLNRYFIFRKVRHVAAERITKVIEQNAPSVEASECSNAATHIAPVYEYEQFDTSREEGEESEESFERLAHKFGKREEIAERNVTPKQKNAVDEQILPKDKSAEQPPKQKASKHFIRPLNDQKITIRAYDPPSADESVESGDHAVNVTDLPISEDEPAIRLVPKTTTKTR
jgi:hypothetical protein